MGNARFVAGAWGGKGLTAWLLNESGDVIDKVVSSTGLKAVKNRDFSGALRSACASWITADPTLPFVLSGMVGARGGWREVNYVTCPLNLEDLMRGAARLQAERHPIMLLPGAIHRRPDGHADVMRGEELQVLGIANALDIQHATIVIPGTHAKTAMLDAGRLVGFRTYATGELFDLILKGGLVGGLAQGTDFDRPAFQDGIRRGAAETLSHAIFAGRASVLGDRLPATAVASYISGVLIGAELGDLRATQDHPILVLAAGLLADRYGLALDTIGLKHRLVDAKDAVLAGFQALAPLALDMVS